MATLAIRTRDDIGREKVIVSNDEIEIDVVLKNKVHRRLKVNRIGDVLQQYNDAGVVYWHTYTRAQRQ